METAVLCQVRNMRIYIYLYFSDLYLYNVSEKRDLIFVKHIKVISSSTNGILKVDKLKLFCSICKDK